MRPLGQGGMGAVYEVEEVATGARLALKVMLRADARALVRFKREFRSVAETHHPNLVRLHDLGVEDGLWFYTMELVDGHSILEVLTQDAGSDRSTIDPVTASLALDGDRLDTAELLVGRESALRRPMQCDQRGLIKVVTQVLGALEALHESGIVHRDLKPSNILVDIDGQVRVLDFGLVHALDADEEPSSRIVGTVAYMAPEQCAGGPVGPAADLYALGCVIYRLITGELPHLGSGAEIIRSRLRGAPPDVSRRVSDVPVPLVRLCSGLLERDVESRLTIDEARSLLALSPGTQSARTSTAPIGRPSFVGRTQELAALHALVTECIARRDPPGEIKFALVSGESGLGKSALADEVALRASESGAHCLNGRCYQRERVPFVAFDRLVDHLARELCAWSPAELAPLSESLHVLRLTFPVLELVDADDNTAPDLGRLGRGRLDRVMNAFATLLNELQRRAPIVLTLDDLQWADRESMSLLEHLLEHVRGRVVILGLTRPDPVMLPALIGLTGEGETHLHIPLEPLTFEESLALTASFVGAELSSDARKRLAERSAGNPFFTLALARHARTVLDRGEGGVSVLSAEQVTVQHIVSEAVAALGPGATVVLEVAVTAGRDVAVTTIGQISGLSAGELDAALLQLGSMSLIKPLSDRGAARQSRYDVFHDRIREAVYDRLHKDRRVEIHSKFAAELERAATRDVEALRYHWSGVGNVERRRHYTVLSAERAANQAAFHHAIELYSELIHGRDEGGPARQHVQWLSQSCVLSEILGRLPEAVDTGLEALETFLALDDLDTDGESDRSTLLHLRARVAEVLLASGRLIEGRKVLAAALTSIGLRPERSLPAQLATLGSLQFAQARARKRLRRRGAARQANTYDAALLRFYDTVARVLLPLWPVQAAVLVLRGELLGIELDDPAVQQRAVAARNAFPSIARFTPSSGFQERVEADLAEAERMARVHELPDGMALVQLFRGPTLWGHDLSAGQRSIDEALESFDRIGLRGSPDAIAAQIFLLQTLGLRGDYQAGLRVADSLIVPNDFIKRSSGRSFRATSLALLGRIDEATQELELFLGDLASAQLPNQFTLARPLIELALANSRGDYRAALQLASGSTRGVKNMLNPDLFLYSVHVFAVEAALGLKFRGESLNRAERGQLKLSVRWLAKRPTAGLSAMAHRARGLLAHLDGKTRSAENHVRLALETSKRPEATNHHYRWLCLEAAKLVGLSSPQLGEEARRLQADHAFVHVLELDDWESTSN